MSRKLFEHFIFKQFINVNNLTNYENTDINHFRQICFKLNYFMIHIPIPYSIKLNSYYEAVIVEFRILPHIEFIIRNAIHKLDRKWSFTVICGNLNYTLVSNICNNISKNIKIIKLDYDNMTQQEYSNFLMTKTFWDLLYGEKILIYQEDSLIFKNNISDFIKYDFIGAPFLKMNDDTPNHVGNGGLSLRTKTKMIEVINNCPIENFILGSSTAEYMKLRNLTVVPEDVYFSKNLQEFNIGDVADWDTAYNFSSESEFNNNSFGCHRLWICTDMWASHINKIFNYKLYKPAKNIKLYLEFTKKPFSFDQTQQKPNAFDIDLFFFCKVNNIAYINEYTALLFFSKIGMTGVIYHPKQLSNFFPNITFYHFLNNIYVFYNDIILPVQDFVNKYLYNTNFDYFNDLSLVKKYDYLNDNYDLILLVYIGNCEKGFDLINKIIHYKTIQKEFNVAFCFNSNLKNFKNFSDIKKIIKNNFDFYAIYYCKEYGTDITPTMLMYNDIIKKHHDLKHIIKLHTKSKSSYQDLTKFLLSVPLSELVMNQRDDCNCIGSRYKFLKYDIFNETLIEENLSKINSNSSFVNGTIFYTTNIVFKTVLDFIKNNNYKAYLLNNLYENNSINKDYSPVHFVERLYGIINI